MGESVLGTTKEGVEFVIFKVKDDCFNGINRT